jgi:hypothetical protein
MYEYHTHTIESVASEILTDTLTPMEKLKRKYLKKTSASLLPIMGVLYVDNRYWHPYNLCTFVNARVIIDSDSPLFMHHVTPIVDNNPRILSLLEHSRTLSPRTYSLANFRQAEVALILCTHLNTYCWLC